MQRLADSDLTSRLIATAARWWATLDKALHRYASPSRFVRLATVLTPWCAVITVILLASGVVWSLFYAPPDYQQGDSVRIMYVHVPSAWMAMFIYGVITTASSIFLVLKLPLADIVARSAAPIGAAFTFLALVTGSLWGKPMWGTWWVWDARLTSVLVLFFLYLGYMALAGAFDDPNRGARAAAILALVGGVNIPIIKFSVDWWSTLHQPASIIRVGGPTIHASMLVPLLLMIFAFTFYFLTLLFLRARGEVVARKLRVARVRHLAR